MNISELKETVCEANLALVRHGLVTLTWGNVGEVTEDGEILVIKPSGVSYEHMKPSDMVLVRRDGTVCEGDFRPSSDTPTYLELLKFFERFQQNHPEAAALRGIVHTHSTHAVAWAQARREIPCFGTTHADHFYGSVPVTRPLTREEVENAYEKNTGIVIAERFEEGRLNPVEVPAVLAAGHGPFAWGKNAQEAVKNAAALEAVAQMALCTQTISGDSPALEDYVQDKHYHRKHGSTAYYGQLRK